MAFWRNLVFALLLKNYCTCFKFISNSTNYIFDLMHKTILWFMLLNYKFKNKAKYLIIIGYRKFELVNYKFFSKFCIYITIFYDNDFEFFHKKNPI